MVSSVTDAPTPGGEVPRQRPPSGFDPVTALAAALPPIGTGSRGAGLVEAAQGVDLAGGGKLAAALLLVQQLLRHSDPIQQAEYLISAGEETAETLALVKRRALVRLLEDLGRLDETGEAVLTSVAFDEPPRSGVVAAAGGKAEAFSAVVKVLERAASGYPEAALAVADDLRQSEPVLPDDNVDSGMVAVTAVEWWCEQNPGAPVRLSRSDAGMTLATFAPLGPDGGVAAQAIMLFDWPAGIPEVVTAESLLDAILGSYSSADRRNIAMDKDALVASDLIAPLLLLEVPDMRPKGSVPARHVDELLTGRTGLGVVPPAIVEAARMLRPWAGREDEIYVIEKPGTDPLALVGDKVALAVA
jgi:hypothetical protein